MLVIPAIDLRKGRCVRLSQGLILNETVFSREPAAVALTWQNCRAKALHIVDLDGALSGTPKNLEAVYEIARKVSIPIQLGGGLRLFRTIREVLSKGVQNAIVATRACISSDFVRKIYKKFGDRIIVSVDVREDKIAVRGWTKIADEKPTDFVRRMEKCGIKTIIFTDTEKDGMLGGPNMEGIMEILKSVKKMKVIAAGGITSIDDVKKLKKMEKEGLTGIILGKAIYTGRINLKDAIKIGEE